MVYQAMEDWGKRTKVTANRIAIIMKNFGHNNSFCLSKATARTKAIIVYLPTWQFWDSED